MYINKHGVEVYEVGDIVKIRDPLDYGVRFGINSQMRSMSGLTAEIESVKDANTLFPAYRFKYEDWNWDNGMIDGLVGVEINPDEGELELNNMDDYLVGFSVV